MQVSLNREPRAGREARKEGREEGGPCEGRWYGSRRRSRWFSFHIHGGCRRHDRFRLDVQKRVHSYLFYWCTYVHIVLHVRCHPFISAFSYINMFSHPLPHPPCKLNFVCGVNSFRKRWIWKHIYRNTAFKLLVCIRIAKYGGTICR